MKKICIFFLLIIFQAQASVEFAGHVYFRNKDNLTEEHYLKITEKLVENGFYFSALPWLKKFLVLTNKTKLPRSVDQMIEGIVQKVGLKEFEVFSMAQLQRTSSPSLRYIRARKYFSQAKYSQVLKELELMVEDHSLYPYALLLKGSTHSIMGEYRNSQKVFEKCVNYSNSAFKEESQGSEKVRLKINGDYCQVGIARALFAAGKFEEARKQYAKIPKSSMIWPEILFEEAWNFYYLNEFNRVLGKLVTYQSPFLDFVHNPEVDILRSLAFIKLCLWSDAREVVDKFYDAYNQAEQGIKNFVQESGTDYLQYLTVAQKAEKGSISKNKILNRMFKSIVKEPVYQDLWKLYSGATAEYQRIQALANSTFKEVLVGNIERLVTLQKNIIGAHVRKRLVTYYVNLQSAFQQMGYIKLEILGNMKQELVDNSWSSKKRGDIKYLKRDKNQYYWGFNGEFWADELGDHVFALAPECQSNVINSSTDKL